MPLRLSILAASLLLFRLAAAEETSPAPTVALPADQSAAAWKLPPGFKATLFAGEPAITQPMAFTFDDRGRLWVLECLSYPTWKEEAGEGQDRITILEDTDGDGVHDKRKVFYGKGLNFSSIEYGFGGVWVTAVPQLLFIPDANGDDQPDGPPQVLLDGFDLKARHNVVGNLAWGPDGWLYGLNGILSNSKIGRPGAADADRVAMNCGVWRYHPVRHTFEAYAHGTTNPWGIDWDERGQMFITNCVIKHIFHVVPGAHFERMFGQDINPHSYGLIQSCADHFHWAGGHWTSSRRGQEANYPAHSDAGGGHAHSGCMIYLGDNWPAEYRGNAFMVNLHGQRLNRDILEREGSGYVAEHGEDFAFSQDPWFRGVAVKYGPDGGVYVADWSDTGECHDYTEEDCDKGGGRIFKIVYRGEGTGSQPTGSGAFFGQPTISPQPGSAEKDRRTGSQPTGSGAFFGQPTISPQPGSAEKGSRPPELDLAKLDDAALVDLQLQSNEWLARHARRLLHERAAEGKLTDAEKEQPTGSGAFFGQPTISPLPGSAEKGSRPLELDLAKLDDAALVDLQLQTNEWLARHARRLLQERAARGKLTGAGKTAIKEMLLRPEWRSRPPRTMAADSVRALFTWHVTGLLDEAEVCRLIEQSPLEEVRGQLALLATDAKAPSPAIVESLAKAAASDKSPYVRLHIAAALQRIPLDQRWPIAEALLSHAEDADDHNLPLMYWYTIEPLAAHDPRNAMARLPFVQIPLVRQYLTRRLVSTYESAGGESGSAAWILNDLVALLGDPLLEGEESSALIKRLRADARRRLADGRGAGELDPTKIRLDIVRGLNQVFQGRRDVKPPPSWKAVSSLSNFTYQLGRGEARDELLTLSMIFRDQRVIGEQLAVLADLKAPTDQRRKALERLLISRPPQLFETLSSLSGEDEVRGDVIRALAAFDDPLIPKRLLEMYPKLLDAERRDAIQTLTARPEFALALLDAIDKGTVPRKDVSALVIRQLLALEHTTVTDRLRQVWGEIRPASADKQARIAAFKEQLTADVLKAADLSNGRGVFTTRCASCHKLFDAGTKLGPELTGAQRHNLDYVLDNVLDPSAIVPREYRPSVLRLVDGRIVQGVIQEETPQTLVVQTANEIVRVPTIDIEARKESGISMMPEGLLDRLSAESIRDLVAYLASPTQVPLPPGYQQPAEGR